MHETQQVAESVQVANLPGAAAGTVADTPGLSCPWCAGHQSEPVWPKRETGEFRLERCSSCRLVSTVPQFAAAKIAGYYPPSYYGVQNARFYALMELLVGWFRRRRAARLRALHQKPGAVLDIGCGRGHFLGWLRTWCWSCTGTELSDAAAHHARQVLGLDVRVGAYQPGVFPDAAFDAVYLWHVLEHLPATRNALSDMRRILRPDGMLVIAV